MVLNEESQFLEEITVNHFFHILGTVRTYNIFMQMECTLLKLFFLLPF